MKGKRILIDGSFGDETRVAVVDSGVLQDYDREDIYFKQQKGDIYLAEITRVEYSLQAVFVVYGGDRHGFLPFADIHPDYWNIADNNLKDLSVVDFIKPSGFPSVRKELKIKVGQYVVVQVVREERGEKGVALTSYITLAGKYCVLLCNSNTGGGISRKVVNPQDRQFLRNKLQSLNIPRGMSVILRTAVKDDDGESIEKDYKYLTRLWDFILATAMNVTQPQFIHSEEDIIRRTVRDLTNSTISEIVVEGQVVFDKVKQSLEMIYGEKHLPIILHKGEPLFNKYKVNEQINELYNNKIVLPSGASMVIDITEALVAIDINSGKSHSETLEETALKVNLEATKEIARQIRLRDLAGIIVIDFIDMNEERNKRTLENAMWQATKDDRAKVQIAKISPFGLLELSRQRLSASQRERINEVCPCCAGTGKIKSKDLVAMNIIRDIKNIILVDKINVITLTTNEDLMNHIVNYRRKEISKLEEVYKVFIILEVEKGFADNDYTFRKRKQLTEEEKLRLLNKQEIEVDIIESLADFRINEANKQPTTKKSTKKVSSRRLSIKKQNTDVVKTEKSGFFGKLKKLFDKK
ncbi:MAG: Rne/Rng family ribonuclease [Rickettsiales bacterium]|jgi:ribonuclease E|nr:Rne/Rng family ribonuclease [Rickettsiales bacterium]